MNIVVTSLAFLSLFCDVTFAQNASDDNTLALSASSGIYIEFENDLVTLRIRDMAISDALQAIAQESELVIYLHDVFDERITLDVEGLPLTETLARVLRDYNFALHYVKPASVLESDRVQTVSRLWVYADNMLNNGFEQSVSNLISQVQVIEPPILKAQVKDEESDLSEHNLALFEEDKNIRMDAIDALASMDDPQAVETLAHALGDQDVSVREQAVDALAEHGDSVSVELLEQAINDVNASVRHTAIGALGEIGTQDSIQILGTALRYQDPKTREEAVYALSNVNNKAAAQLIEESLKDAEISVRLAAIEALIGIDTNLSAAAALAVVLDDENSIVREEVIHALGEIGGKDAYDLLQKATNDKNRNIATLANDTLATFSGQ